MTIQDFIGKQSPSMFDIGCIDAINGLGLHDGNVRRDGPDWKEWARGWMHYMTNFGTRKLLYSEEQLFKTWG